MQENGGRRLPERLDFIPAREVLVIEEDLIQQQAEAAISDNNEKRLSIRDRDKQMEDIQTKAKQSSPKKINKPYKSLNGDAAGAGKGSAVTMKRSKSDLEVASLATRRTPLSDGLFVRPPGAASPAPRPQATVNRTQSVYKVNQTPADITEEARAGGRRSSQERTAVSQPPPVAATSVIRSAVSSAAASTFPRAGPAATSLLGVETAVAAKASNSTFPRRRPSEFDGRATMRGSFHIRAEESAGFIQVADLEVVAEPQQEKAMEVASMEPEEEEMYQIPKHPVPVALGRGI
jgi:hypothetical protein